MILFLDTETYCETPITAGTHRYAEDVEVMIITWAVDDGPVQTVDRTAGDDMSAFEQFVMAFNEADLIVAHHVAFDRTVLRHGLGLDRPIRNWHCTTAQALAHSLPASLDVLSDVYQLDKTYQAKNKNGKKYIQMFCKPCPRSMKVRRRTRETHPKEWKLFCEYAAQDVEAMRALYKGMPRWNWTESEREAWYLNMTINERGLLIDQDLARQAIDLCAREKERLKYRVKRITQTELEVTQRDALLAHLLDEYGVGLPDMQASTLEARLNDPDLPEPVRELLAIRLEYVQTSNAKWPKLLKSVSSDGRLRGTSQFCGASRTGRDSGRMFQPLNLPRPPRYLKKEIGTAVELVRAGVADQVYENPMEVTSACLRGALIAPPGRKLVVADLNAIEGRVAAWVAAEQWKLDAYAAGADLYVLAYARAFGVDPASVTDEQRQIGKVMELALGFGGSVGAFGTMAAGYGVTLPEDTVREVVAAWRAANPNIVQMWRDLERAAKKLSTGRSGHADVGRVRVERQGSWTRIRLPSGRYLSYPSMQYSVHNIRGLGAGKPPREELSYMGTNQYTRKWERLTTYGGKLFENVVQAVARDVLVEGMKRIEAAGYETCLSIYDECVAEADPDASLERFVELLATTPDWAPGLPLAAGGFETDRYRKD